MPESECQAPWGYLCASVDFCEESGGILWPGGVDKLRSCVYAGKDNKDLVGLIEHKELGNGGL